jgi:hypothetical protein
MRERTQRNVIECETLRGFHTSAAGVTPAPSTNRKMARTPFCAQVLFPVACVLCHPERSRGTPDLSRREPTHPQPRINRGVRRSSFIPALCVIQSPSTSLRTGSAKNPGYFFCMPITRSLTLKDLRKKCPPLPLLSTTNSAKSSMASFLLLLPVCTRWRLQQCDLSEVWQLSRRLSPRSES